MSRQYRLKLVKISVLSITVTRLTRKNAVVQLSGLYVLILKCSNTVQQLYSNYYTIKLLLDQNTQTR